MSIMAPFYLAGGFALYLTRRTQIEAWDLELVFRRAWARPPARPPAGHRPSGVARGRAAPDPGPVPGPGRPARRDPGTCLGPGHPGRRRGQSPDRGGPRGPDFGSRRQVEGWVYVGDQTDPEDPENLKAPAWAARPGEGHRRRGDTHPMGTGPGRGGPAGLAPAPSPARPPARPLDPAPAAGPGPHPGPGDGRAPGPLPQDIPEAVRAQLAAGETRAALALLYRGAIRRLRGLGVSIPTGATEGDCLNAAARARPPAETDYLRRLTGFGWVTPMPTARSPLRRWRTCCATGGIFGQGWPVSQGRRERPLGGRPGRAEIGNCSCVPSMPPSLAARPVATRADPARLVVLGLSLIGLALAGAWFLRNFERGTYEIEEHASAAARRNPFLAAELFLRRLGNQVTAMPGRDPLRDLPPAGDILVVKGLGPQPRPAGGPPGLGRGRGRPDRGGPLGSRTPRSRTRTISSPDSASTCWRRRMPPGPATAMC